MNIEQNIVLSIKNSRAKLGFSQQELADKIGVAKTTLANWEGGRQSPPLDKFAQIIELANGEEGIKEFWSVSMGSNSQQVVNKGSGIGIQNNGSTKEEILVIDEINKLFARVYTTAKNYEKLELLKQALEDTEKQIIKQALGL